VRALRDARGHFVSGKMSEAMMHLREAAEALTRLDSSPQPPNLLRLPPADTDPPELRARRLLAAARALTHLGPHQGDMGGPPAQELVRAAMLSVGAVLAFAVARRADVDPAFWNVPPRPLS